MQRTNRDRRWALLAPVLLILTLAACSIEEAVDPEPEPEVIPTPFSGSVDHSVPVDLSWEIGDEIAWGDSFKVYCDTTRPPRVEVYAGTALNCTVGDLLDGRTYYWKLAAADSAGQDYEFGSWSFATRPFLCTVRPEPVDLTTNLEIDPFLNWTVASASDTPSYYLAYVDTVNPPHELVYAGADSVCRVYGLEYETQYWWRITAVDGSDNTDSTGPWTFTTGPPLFLVDLAPAPADSSDELDRVVTLSWEVVSESAPTENWVVFLDADPQPTTLVYAGTETEVTLTDLRYGLTYYWAVTAFDDDGHTFTNGPWRLEIREFDVDLEPSPADGSTQVATTGNLSWNVTRGGEMVVNYLVCLDTNAQPTTPVYAGPLTSLDLGSLALAPGTTYWWKVTALDVDGFTCPLDPWSFTTAP